MADRAEMSRLRAENIRLQRELQAARSRAVEAQAAKAEAQQAAATAIAAATAAAARGPTDMAHPGKTNPYRRASVDDQSSGGGGTTRGGGWAASRDGSSNGNQGYHPARQVFGGSACDRESGKRKMHTEHQQRDRANSR